MLTILEFLQLIYALIYFILTGGGVGRPLRHRGRQLVSRPQSGEAWLGDVRPDVSELSQKERDELAQLWLQDAAEEHASIAAFSKLSLSLQALGAPPELLRLTHQAALDEITHATLCYSLASAYAGRPIAPSMLPELLMPEPARDVQTELVSLAVDSLLDGCWAEGCSAIIASHRLSKAQDPTVRRALTILAKDEARHQELAWKIVEWCIHREPARIEEALTRAEVRIPMSSRLRGGDTETIAAHGYATDADVQEKLSGLREELKRRLEKLQITELAA